ncbi:hypothetical protein QAD02_015721 [Eretmocerus hayati]|uniref:Uncharacterized protein n=1 Tax=Eretmocerus hayati TaxID=131215 RepID=A0ACC2P9G3_9HYME|nr:hypothetical protein QAD02_015721 [Eretmocerus hayati]
MAVLDIFFKIQVIFFPLAFGNPNVKNKHPLLGSEENNRVFHLASHIANQCFGDSGTLVLSKETLNQSVSSMLNLPNPINIFMENEDSPMRKHLRHRSIFKINEEIVKNLTEPVSSVIMIVQEDTNVTKLMDEFRNSIWWRHDAPYLLIGGSEDKSCARANEFLATLWTFEILNAIFLCTKPANRSRILTLNPYRSIFPSSWETVGKVNSGQQNVTLLQYISSNRDALSKGTGSSYCKSLFFDKVKDVQGYNFKTTYTHPPIIGFEYIENKTGYERCSGIGLKPLCLVLSYINATFTAKKIKSSGFVNKDGKPEGSLLDISTKTVDFLNEPYYLRGYWRIQTYPFYAGVIKIVTHKKPMTFRGLLIYYLNFQMLVTMILLYILLMVALKYSLNTSWSSVVMEYLRILVGAATIAKPQKSASRLTFIFVTLSMTIVTSCLQGYLSATRTSPENMPAVDTETDLIESKLIPCGQSSLKDMISNEYLINLYIVINDQRECLRLMLNGSPIACIVDGILIPYTFDGDPRVHVSRNNFFERGVTLIYTENSPLSNKINQVLFYMREAGFIEFLWDKWKLRVDDNYSEEENVCRSFMYENEVTVVYTLCTVWSVSLIVFLIEIAYFNIIKLNPSHNRAS